MERPEWQWSPSLRKFYYLDARTGDYVLQDGTRRPGGSAGDRDPSKSIARGVSGPSSSATSKNDPTSGAAYPYTAPRPTSQKQRPQEPHAQGHGREMPSARAEYPGQQPFGDANTFTRTGQGPGYLFNIDTTFNADLLPSNTNASQSLSTQRDHTDRTRAQILPVSAMPGQALAERHPSSVTTGPHPPVQVVDRSSIDASLRSDSDILQSYNHSQRTAIYDPRTGVTTIMINGPAPAYRTLYGTGGESEVLFSSYKVRKRNFFCIGRVFLVLWAEPAGEMSRTVISSYDVSDLGLSTSRFNERVYSKVRRFVVIREGPNYCSALPIMTYEGRGVAKSGIKKSEHAIVYTGRTPPVPSVAELPVRGEQCMRPGSIRVVPDDKSDVLHPASRLDFGKVHTVYHNIKVRAFGMVHRESIDALRFQFVNVWMGSDFDGLGSKSSQKEGSSLEGGRPDQGVERKARSPSPGISRNPVRQEQEYSDGSEDGDDDEEEEESVDDDGELDYHVV